MAACRNEAKDETVRMRRCVLAAMICSAVFWSRPYAAWTARISDHKPNSAQKAPAPEDRVDINHASVEELMRVPGMKRSWANRIVRFRPYRTKQDLLDYGIVSPGVLCADQGGHHRAP
jgi:DNA uptake protein ComE-like DNA-binding protein